MSNAGHEFSARSVDEAIAAGLKTLGLRSDQVDVIIVNKGSRGIFGIGSEPALVRLTPKAVPSSVRVPESIAQPTQEASVPVVIEESATEKVVEKGDVTATFPAIPQPAFSTGTPVTTDSAHHTDAPTYSEAVTTTLKTLTGETQADKTQVPTEPEEAKPKEAKDASTDSTRNDAEVEAIAQELLSRILQLMGFDATLQSMWKEGEDEQDERVLWLDVQGEGIGALIGRHGETLDDLQYLLRMMVNQRLHQWNDIVIDVDHYRARRVEQLTQLANRMANQVASSKRALALEPMPPNERRVIHMILRQHPDVYTQSAGDGERRKVYIVPKSQ